MQLYTENDIALLDNEIDNLVDKIDREILTKYEPTRKEIDEYNQIVLDFIKVKKRKLYGGYAQNALVKAKQPSDAFYSEKDIPDIDVYSPDPINDAIELCNIFFEKGYKYVEAKEAIHAGTYKVFVNFQNVCDLSYVPKNIYHKLPFVEINGYNYVAPSFIMLDLYTIFTDPHFSAFRWKKVFSRIYLLQKYYPFHKATKSLPLNNIKNDPILNELTRRSFDFILQNDHIILYGDYVYNYLLYESKMPQNNIFKYIPITKFECITEHYVEDANKLYNLLHSYSDKVRLVEFYPFWTYLGYTSIIYYENTEIIRISNYNKKCIPIHEVPALVFDKDIKKEKNKIKIVSYDRQLLLNMIWGLKMREMKMKKELHIIIL